VAGKDDYQFAAFNGFLELDMATSLGDDFEASASQGAQDLPRAEQLRH
jgi:hypothetical protein